MASVEDETITEEIVAYPNPNEGSFRLSNDNVEKVTLYDISGNSETIENPTGTIATSLKGLVIAKIQSGFKISTIKLIIK